MLWIVAVLAAIVVASSYVRGAAKRARAELAGRRQLRLVVKLAGDAMATRAEMRERFSLEEAIASQRIGTIVDSGSADGVMWLIVAVADADRGPAQLAALVEAAGLTARSRVY